MKPIKLTIDGLNSFETKQELDFQSLTGGVFGIFGKTGSGKSTILDAITLSLYGKVERSKQNIDFINTKCSKATVSFEFSILVSGENKTFEIKRTFSKKKNAKEIESSAELYEIDCENKKLIEEGTNKVNDKIFGIIGLGVNEFAKCIALPQGEFAAFLQAKPAERTEIMSNIFNLSEYGEQLMAKVKTKAAELDKQVSVLSASASMVEYATDEKLAETSNSLDEKKNEYDLQSKKLQGLSNIWSEQKKNFDKLQELKTINEKLEKLEKEKEDISKLQVEIEKSQSANQIKTDYEKLKKDENDIKDLASKIAELGELKLQKQSSVVEAENNFNDLKNGFDSRIIELNSKLAKLQALAKYDEDITDAKVKKEEALQIISQKQMELAEELQNNSYLENDLSKLQEEVEKIDEFIGANKADVELSYALEQTKEIESEILLLDEMIGSLDKIIDQANEDLKQAHDEYNDAIAEEKNLHQSREKIENSIGVAFEDSDSTDFNKVRSCDKQLEGMREVVLELDNIDKLIAKLNDENVFRENTITQIENDVLTEQNSLTEIENAIAKKEVELSSNQTTREELLGESVISLIAEHLEVGDTCPVCSSQVPTKIYSEKTDFGPIENEIESNKVRLKNLRYERDKILASLVSLKSRVEFERNQIEKNKQEINTLFNGKSSLYLRFVDDNDESAENFNKLYSLLTETVGSLENLIDLQEKVREDERKALIKKTQAGTRISLVKTYLEDLGEILYNLNKKKAERDFAIFNVNEKYQNLNEYKKQIVEGKNIELVIDGKKEERARLKDRQFELSNEKSKSDLKIAGINAEINLQNDRLLTFEQTIAELSKKILASGVPDGASVETEKTETEKIINNLKVEYTEKQSLYETNKEALSRIENDYSISESILKNKQDEVENLTATINLAMQNNDFSSYTELERCFADSSEIKIKQTKVNEFNTNFALLTAQKSAIENEKLETVDEIELKATEKQINELNEIVKNLTTDLGKLGAELERITLDNAKYKEFKNDLAVYTKKLDLAKELSTVLRGKALAEYVCEEYLQQITDSANQKLAILMDGRYTLKFENKEFFVEDNFNDGITRPASTLSGGETFVVSLSLALSISDAISLLSSRSMDFFFLDEGFGTLDSELCSVVVSSLYKLESQNLKIGLISHVTELEESIKNKVIVTKDNGGTKLKIEHSL